MDYRREVDGLRALAVLPVIFFHAGYQAFSGGFVGVDIFFVISGYLITSIILAEKQAGTFSLLNFYERRARRILPALFFVMLVCLPFAWFWLAPKDLTEFSKSLKNVPIFISNILFYKETGYFDTAAELKPLLHTWSLAVEEQYYLFFPALLTAIWILEKKFIISLLAVIFLTSLFYAHHLITIKPSAAFYLLPSRLWEILIGALIAFYMVNKDLQKFKPVTEQSASIIGLVLILYSIFFFNAETPFPSFYTLFPTIGAALIIIFANNKNFVGQLLGTSFLVGIGLISYSTYLWHQPLLVFARHRNIGELSSYLILILTLLSFIFAYFTWKYVEQPFRNRLQFTSKSILLFAISCSVFFISIGFIGKAYKGFPERFKNIPASILLSLEPNNLRVDCNNEPKDGALDSHDVDFCAIGNTLEKPSIAVFGDSHSMALLPAFNAAGKDLGLSLVHIGLGGCPPLMNVDIINGNYRFGVCSNLAKRGYEYVVKNGIKKVFLVARWSLYTDGKYDGSKMYFMGLSPTYAKSKEISRELFTKSLNETVKAYQAVGVDLYLVAQVPLQKIDSNKLYGQMYSFAGVDKQAMVNQLSISKIEHKSLQMFTRTIFSDYVMNNQFNLIVLDDIFCNESVCLIGQADKSFYSDEGHLSNFGALMATDRIKTYLK